MALLAVSIVNVDLPFMQEGLKASPLRPAMGCVRVRGDVRPRTAPVRTTRRRLLPAHYVPDRYHRFRGSQRHVRVGVVTTGHHRLPAVAGCLCRRSHAAGDRHHPAVVPWRRAGPPFWLLRGGRGDIDCRRAAAGWRPDRCVRFRPGVAGRVLRQPSHRPGGDPLCGAVADEGRGEEPPGIWEATAAGPGRFDPAGNRRGLSAASPRGAAAVVGRRAVSALRGGSAVTGGLRGLGATGRCTR